MPLPLFQHPIQRPSPSDHRVGSSNSFTRLRVGSLALRPALLLCGNLRPRVTTTPLPHATKAYGQLLGRDFNPLDLLLLLRTVGPEFCFDEQRGDLFVARVAGNYLTTDFVATLEFATFVLHTPLIMVFGHESCGAVQAAIEAADKNEQFPGHIQAIASALAPAVRAVDRKSNMWLLTIYFY